MADTAGLQVNGLVMASITASVFLIAAVLILRTAPGQLDDRPAARQAHVAVMDRT
jgi:hypothetical protein